MKMMICPVGPLQANAYIYFNEDTKDAVMVDPGGDADELIRAVKKRGLNLKLILLTHGHFDHVEAAVAVREATGACIAVHQDDRPMLEDAALNQSGQFCKTPVSFTADRLLNDGDRIDVCGRAFAVIHTPGHTPGGVCFYDEAEKILFSGDTLFYRSIGRTDFPGGSFEALELAVQNKLYALPEDVTVFPGHGQPTTIGDEKTKNPFVSQRP